MPVRAFREAVELRDMTAVEKTLAADVTFFSPVMVRPYRGRTKVAAFLRVLSEVLQEFRYTQELWNDSRDEGGRTHVLLFDARVEHKPLQGVDVLEYDAAGLVTSLVVMVRPLPAAMTLARTVGARMEQDTPAAGGPAGAARPR
ncbi:SnoaL-like domain-containing protein [Streptomyces sp. SB3404]|uniref:SnoaL-like domain-containing protein n=2 Tax=Streptomyces boncukensis TaxID=2711219 RepID=A0A6G4WR29_9ACTN|nr:SnoaL-like domain-containing protein [Streptomyces boncukensis]